MVPSRLRKVMACAVKSARSAIEVNCVSANSVSLAFKKKCAAQPKTAATMQRQDKNMRRPAHTALGPFFCLFAAAALLLGGPLLVPLPFRDVVVIPPPLCAFPAVTFIAMERSRALVRL